MMKENYKCSICGKEHVKLWRPYSYFKQKEKEFLICAECAENRQTTETYEECIWKKIDCGYLLQYTGRQLNLPKWKVNEKGYIPEYYGPTPDDLSLMTDILIISLKELNRKVVAIIPAILNESGEFWIYPDIPEEHYKCWEELPTR